VGARPPPFVPPLPLWRRRRLRRDARPGAVTAPTCATLRRAVTGHTGRADAVSMGHTPLCNWAEREFGLVILDLVFVISEYIQILTNLKIYVGFI
jgi:hypothetical protein